jgi:pimeloyl-ACP methyl ester carboxylesterase
MIPDTGDTEADRADAGSPVGTRRGTPSSLPAVTDRIEPTPFIVEVSDADLDDLRSRLARTRWPEAETVSGTAEPWSQGMPLEVTRELAEHWRTDYDWRIVEARLNAHPQFRAQVDGLGIHFLHVRSPHPDALPLILTHGWPGSVVEFLDVIGPLTDPEAHGGRAEDAFHLVVPSLPGFGWSDRPSSPGWNVPRIAAAWEQLMLGLGYDRFGAQGGDWGSMVTAALGSNHPEHLAGIHLNMPLVLPDPATMDDLTEGELTALAAFDHYQQWDSGYSTQQSTRPQTVGYGLTDSPVGQLAWIVEKFWAWTDCDGDPRRAVDADRLLDNVMVYWTTRTAASSARLYWESFKQPDFSPISVPVGCSIFPKEIFRTSRRWAEQRFSDLRHFGELDRGGHFAAFEQPELFVTELRSAFATMR